MKLGKALPSDKSALCAIAQSYIVALTMPETVVDGEVGQSDLEPDQSKAFVQSPLVEVTRNPLKVISF